MFVIHIGLPKCASAALQEFFSGNAESLRRIGIEYPQEGRQGRKAHNLIALEVLGHRKSDALLGSITSILSGCRQSGYHSAIISSEALERADGAAISRLKAALTEQEGVILVFVRELTSLVPSSYAQKVRYGRNLYDFDEFFESRIRETRIDFFKTVSRWAATFGWPNMRVRLVHPDHLVNGNIFDEALAIFGVDGADEACSELTRPGNVNVSPGWKVLEAVRALYGGKHGLPQKHPLVPILKSATGRRSDPGWRVVGNTAAMLGSTRGWNDDRGRYLTLEQARECSVIFKRAVVALNDHLTDPLPVPPDFNDLAFPAREFLPDHTQIPAQELRSFYDELGEVVTNRPINPSRRNKRRLRRSS
ncbi:MAG TPA: hypothetical protein VGK90_01605 [Rhizomicrobium sp.]